MTSVGAVKARLVEILTLALPATGSFPASQVVPGPVDVTTLRSRALEVGGNSTPLDFDVTSLDLSTGTRKYTLILTASVSVAGTDMAVAEDQAEADFLAAVAAIRANPSLGLENLSAQVFGNGELVESTLPASQQRSEGRSAAVRFPVLIFTPL